MKNFSNFSFLILQKGYFMIKILLIMLFFHISYSQEVDADRTFTTFNKVIPNPSNGLTKFVLESPDEGIISLNIYITRKWKTLILF